MSILFFKKTYFLTNRISDYGYSIIDYHTTNLLQGTTRGC